VVIRYFSYESAIAVLDLPAIRKRALGQLTAAGPTVTDSQRWFRGCMPVRGMSRAATGRFAR